MLKRRDFLYKSGVGLAGAALLPTAVACAQAQSKRKLGIALVGLGNYSRGKLGPALRETKRCYLAGIVTGTPEKATQWQAEYGISPKHTYSYDNFDEIANDPDIDVIYIVLPNAMHAAYTIRAAKAGKHVICEKPMAVTVAECDEMIAACRENNVHLSIGYRLHYDPHNLEMMRLGQQQVHGPVKLIEASDGWNGVNWENWRFHRELSGGGAMMDVGIYCIQGARYVTGEEPISVRAQEFKTHLEKFKEVEETITWQMRFPSGAAANCATSYATSMDRLYVGAEKGRFDLEPAFGYGKIVGTVNGQRMKQEHINQQAAQMDAFAGVVLDGDKNLVPGEMGRQDVKIIQAIYQAVASGKEVEVPS
ncbi:MAG: Gfo/Idh/MocA family oxidoreductase [Bacteroidota bacterium]